ncbi:MAG: nitronate monooxygenase [Alphaproteobacteria bacterium]|jgi:enoyl-[acyl-carrier protein] reductase II|nr:2-nitropropane dioxygenase [Rhodospirillaceae bacterium]MDP6021989.1 nitronate monooxygenase [Alphaproteobacteria bacterium]MDP6254545.1 nitronate monooxygenase [Alphaproteobacteria bacterium]MDP7055673.1 nitronate monooxygenase [Alphaproteobacteria bacterium]MDP7229364.1 nitronate monooxygenase [Alphaproteobacteria bacterium]
MTALRTPICDLLNIDYPVFQAGMGWVARADLVAAVSAAGGLGCIGAGSTTDADELRAEIRGVRAQTDQPFAVDILFATVASKVDEAVRYTDKVMAMVDVVFEERVPVLISGLGSPRDAVAGARERGIKVMSVVGAVRHAEKAVADGVDAVIASGSDGGGHVGSIGTAALIPAVVDAVDVPVLAGGGLADGRGLLAALSFGAQGVWMGTRFIATQEARAHENYKQKIAETDTAGTVVTRAHSGKTCRLIRNAFTDSWAGREAEIEPYPLQGMHVGHPASQRGRIEGDVENGVLPAGQSSGLIGGVPKAGEVVQTIMAEADAVLSKLTAA